ncbi:MAG TPA: hypothetical protein VIV12_20695 [Streptosporangiaceae bacterium]
MTLSADYIAHARKVADAVLYEGYLLYPYRRSAQKNHARFQFGVLMPPAYASVDSSERSFSRTECLLECPDDARVEVLVRFLRLQQRIVQGRTAGNGALCDVDTLTVDGTAYTSWEEAAEREEYLSVSVSNLLTADAELAFHLGQGEMNEGLIASDGQQVGRLVRRWQTIHGAIVVHAERVGGPYQALRLRIEVQNRTEPDGPLRTRDDGLRHALLASHVLIAVADGAFLSLTDPPEWAAAESAGCTNIGAWPVLAGPPACRNLMLSAPVILADHPEIAAESLGDLFDGTEIDEILTLRTMALSDAEKRQARATDPRAADLMDLERLHGTIRHLAPVTDGTRQPWWDPGTDTSVSPETDHVMIGGTRVARGSRVRMRPGFRRADAQDLFLTGREALVQAVLHDVDGQVHLAVSPLGDPLAELQGSHGRFWFFAPEEIEPMPADPPA